MTWSLFLGLDFVLHYFECLETKGWMSLSTPKGPVQVTDAYAKRTQRATKV